MRRIPPRPPTRPGITLRRIRYRWFSHACCRYPPLNSPPAPTMRGIVTPPSSGIRPRSGGTPPHAACSAHAARHTPRRHRSGFEISRGPSHSPFAPSSRGFVRVPPVQLPLLLEPILRVHPFAPTSLHPNLVGQDRDLFSRDCRCLGPYHRLLLLLDMVSLAYGRLLVRPALTLLQKCEQISFQASLLRPRRPRPSRARWRR